MGSGSHVSIYPRQYRLGQGRGAKRQFSAKEKQERAKTIQTNIVNIVKSLEGVEGLRVFARKNIPERFHYKKNDNAPAILVVADKGTVIEPSPVLAVN